MAKSDAERKAARFERNKARLAALQESGGVTQSTPTGNLNEQIAQRRAAQATANDTGFTYKDKQLTITDLDKAEITDVSVISKGNRSIVVFGDKHFVVEDTAENIRANTGNAMAAFLTKAESAQKVIARVSAPTVAEEAPAEAPANDEQGLTVSFSAAWKPEKHPGELTIVGGKAEPVDVSGSFQSALISGKATLVQAGDDFYVVAGTPADVEPGKTLDAVQITATEAEELNGPAQG